MKLKNKLSLLNDILVTRCCKARDFGKVIDYSLHHSSGASEEDYGQASYLWMVNEEEKIHCALVIRESCVIPMKLFQYQGSALLQQCFQSRFPNTETKTED